MMVATKRARAAVALLALACASACALGSCSAPQQAQESGVDVASVLNETKTYSGPAAATIGDAVLYEEQVSDYIQSYRTYAELEADMDWAKFLIDNGTTAQQLREKVIDSYIEQRLVSMAAEEKGIAPSAQDVEKHIESVKAQYDSDEAWQQALEKTGSSEETYIKGVYQAMCKTALEDALDPGEEPDQADVISHAALFAKAYDGAKRVSRILFSADQQVEAADVLKSINSGELSFADAAQKYSADGASAANGGDLGWDRKAALSDECKDALAKLGEGDVSGLVLDESGISILLCTEVYTAPEVVTDVSQIPAEVVPTIKSSLVSQARTAAYSNWFTSFKEEVGVTVEDMPEGLAYDVDLEEYQTLLDAQAEAKESGDGESAAELAGMM